MKRIASSFSIRTALSAFTLAAFCALGQASPLGKPLPPKLTAAILVKLATFESKAAEKSTLRVHVISDAALFNELKNGTWKTTLVEVSFGPSIPSTGVDVIFISRSTDLDLAIDYSRSNRAIAATDDPRLAKNGASLAVFDDQGLPGILINAAASKAAGLHWKADIMQIAKLTDER